MASAIQKRFAQSAITAWAVITITFALIRLMPGGPMDYVRAQILGSEGGPGSADMDRVNALVEVYTNVNPEKPILEQYIDYTLALANGDLGKSMLYNKPVSDIIAGALPWTVYLMSITLFLTFAIGIVLGAFMAYHEGSKFDTVSTVVGMILNSIPYYVLAIILLWLLAYQVNWFPTGGRWNEKATIGLNWPFMASVIEYSTLPIISFVVTAFGGWALSMRGNSIRVLGEDYLRVARLRGLSSSRIASRYVGRNAILPLYTGFVISIGFAFGGAVILESIFRYTGVGFYLFKSVSARDYPLMMGTFLIITFAVVIGILIADLTYYRIDPRAGGEDREAY